MRARVAALAALVSSACGTPSVAVDAGPDANLPPPPRRVFVAGSFEGRLHIFDWDSLERVAALPLSGASEVHATPDGSLVWVLSRGTATVASLDTRSLTFRYRVPVGTRPVHSFIEPGYERIWVGNDDSADVSVIELATGEEARVLTGTGHHDMAMVPGPDGALRFVYVSNETDGNMIVLDGTPELVTNVVVGPAPHGIDYSSATGKVYNCSGDEENSVEVIDPDAGHTVVARVPLPARCSYLRVSDDDPRVAFATLAAVDLLARIDLATLEVETFDAGDYPDELELVGDRVFVANVLAPTVSVVDLSEGTTRTIEVGYSHVHEGHGHRTLRRFDDRVFVPNDEDHTVSVIDVESETVITTLLDVIGPAGVAVAGPGEGTTFPR